MKPIPKVLYEDAATNVPSTPYYDALNRRVDEIVAKARAVAKEPEIHILVAGDGALVYPNRIVWLPWVMGAVALYLCTTAPSLKGFLCMLPAMYLGYDFYSGVLHVALDDPKNLQGVKSYILFQGCLEFQWHHAIPYDGASKPFIACCADLNIIVLILMVLNCGLLGYTSGTRAALTGLKLFFAYFGQYCHRAAHTPKSKRPKWVQVLQATGFMTPQAKHNGHHRPPHDENFCLIGKMDPAVNGLIARAARTTGSGSASGSGCRAATWPSCTGASRAWRRGSFPSSFYSTFTAYYDSPGGRAHRRRRRAREREASGAGRRASARGAPGPACAG